MASQDLEGRASAGDVRAQVELATQLDAAGRHDDALNWLAVAGRANDPEALRIIGMRLLTGKDAPALPDQGARILTDAARRGDAQAASMAAVLLGGGFFAPQSWRIALDYLRMSAELGSPAARSQLAILTGDQALAAGAAGDDPPPDLWKRLRESVDVEAWTAAPESQALSSEPRIGWVRGLVPPSACDWIVEQSRARLVRAEVHDPRTGAAVMGQRRTNRTANFGLTETSLLNLLIQAKIGSATGAPIQAMEAFAVLNYAVGEEASEHFDYLDPSVPAYAAELAELGQRVATCLLYLNDDYEGGETAFPELGVSHRGRKGDALFFFSVGRDGSPDPRTVHAGRPPTSGEKWVLSQFTRNRPVAPGAGRTL